MTRKPSRSSSLMTAFSNPSSPRARYPIRAKIFAACQSGRSAASEGRRTPPASTSSPTALARKRSRAVAAAPMRHQACGTVSSAARSASPSSARTKTSRPAARQLSITRRGNPPLPAMMPNGPGVESSTSAAIRPFRLADRPARIGADEGDDVVHRANSAEAFRRLDDPVVEGPVLREQELIGAAQPLDVVAAEAAALHADDVEAGQARPVADHHAVGDDVALDPRHAADHRVPTDAHELVHRREPAKDRVVLDHDMAAERRVVDENDVVADLAVMRDMGANHQ